MKKIKIITGITWAFVCLFFMILLFPQLNTFSSSAARLPFMKINPNYTGGEVAGKYVTENCTLVVHEPVFDGLIKERKTGFVQVDWRGKLADKFIDTIDYDLDKKPDFIIQIDRTSLETVLNPLTSKVKDVNVSTPASYGWAARINLKR
jgi:hypothetical protein